MVQSLKLFLKKIGLFVPLKRVVDYLRRWKPSAIRRRRNMKALYSPFIRRGDLVFDIGANVGEVTAAFARLGAKVVSVEPQPACADIIRSKFRRRPEVIVETCAVGGEPGEATMYVADDASILSTLSGEFRQKGRFKISTWQRTITVPVTTLDELIKRHGMPRFCKIDVEGYEIKVLSGLSAALPALSFEFMRELTPEIEKCIALLNAKADYEYNFSRGESMKLVFGDWAGGEALMRRLNEIPDPLLWGDIFARRKNQP